MSECNALNAELVRIRLETMRAHAANPDVADAIENDLLWDFVDHVARHGPPDLAEIAEEILKFE